MSEKNSLSPLDKAFAKQQQDQQTVQLVNHILSPITTIDITRLSYGEDLKAESQESLMINKKAYIIDHTKGNQLSLKEINENIDVGFLEKKFINGALVFEDKTNNYYYNEKGFRLVPIDEITLANGQYYSIDPSRKSVDFTKKNASIYEDGDISTDDHVLYKKDGDLYYRADNKNFIYNKTGQPLIPLSNEFTREALHYWKKNPSGPDQTLNIDSEIRPERSNRAFYVRLKDPVSKNKGQITVTLNISDPDNPQKPVESVQILLYEEKNPHNPGVFRSSPLVLVPDIARVDESIVQNSDKNAWPDNNPHDRTFRAKLGSEISISYQNSENKMITTPLGTVPVKKIVESQLIVFGKENYQNAYQNYIKEIEGIQKILSPLGIQIKINAPILHDEESNSLPQRVLTAAKDYPANRGIRFIAGKQLSYHNLPGVEETVWFKERNRSILMSNSHSENTTHKYAREFVNILIFSVPGNHIKNLQLANERTDSFSPYHRLGNNILAYEANPNETIYNSAFTEAQLRVINKAALLQAPPSSAPQPSLEPKPAL